MQIIKEYDKKFMLRCIELSQMAVDKGDAAFGSLVSLGDKLIAEGINNKNGKVSDHAEILALHNAHLKLGTTDLSECTLYTSCEPCPMCSFMIREYKIKRVVYALPSLYVGGHSKWPILQDEELEHMKPIFSNVPEIIGGYMEAEANEVMKQTPLWMFGSDAKLNK